jgi:hypothetical protein
LRRPCGSPAMGGRRGGGCCAHGAASAEFSAPRSRRWPTAFVVVEPANSEVVGIHASRSANRFEALEPVRQGVHRCFGAIAPGVAHGLKLRHDHGSNYMSGDFQDEFECLGIEASPRSCESPRATVSQSAGWSRCRLEHHRAGAQYH